MPRNIKLTPKLEAYRNKRKELSKAKFTKSHELHKLGLKPNQIKKVMEMNGDKINKITIVDYLRFSNFTDFSQRNSETTRKYAEKNRSKSSEIVEAKTVESEASVPVNQDSEAIVLQSLREAEDKIAEAYELVKNVKTIFIK